MLAYQVMIANELTDMLASPLILLAAGRSTRAQTPKGLIQIEGRPWLNLQFERAIQTGVKHVIVVLGHHREAYLDHLSNGLSEEIQQKVASNHFRISSLINANPNRGQFSSIQTAIEFLNEFDYPTVFIEPVDVPLPKSDLLMRMEEAMRENSQFLVCNPVFGKKKCHPVLIKKECFSEILKLDPSGPKSRLDHFLNELNSNLPGSHVEILTDEPQITWNMNYLSDFKELEKSKLETSF